MIFSHRDASPPTCVDTLCTRFTHFATVCMRKWHSFQFIFMLPLFFPVMCIIFVCLQYSVFPMTCQTKPKTSNKSYLKFQLRYSSWFCYLLQLLYLWLVLIKKILNMLSTDTFVASHLDCVCTGMCTSTLNGWYQIEIMIMVKNRCRFFFFKFMFALSTHLTKRLNARHNCTQYNTSMGID